MAAVAAVAAVAVVAAVAAAVASVAAVAPVQKLRRELCCPLRPMPYLTSLCTCRMIAFVR